MIHEVQWRSYPTSLNTASTNCRTNCRTWPAGQCCNKLYLAKAAKFPGLVDEDDSE